MGPIPSRRADWQWTLREVQASILLGAVGLAFAVPLRDLMGWRRWLVAAAMAAALAVTARLAWPRSPGRVRLVSLLGGAAVALGAWAYNLAAMRNVVRPTPLALAAVGVSAIVVVVLVGWRGVVHAGLSGPIGLGGREPDAGPRWRWTLRQMQLAVAYVAVALGCLVPLRQVTPGLLRLAIVGTAIVLPAALAVLTLLVVRRGPRKDRAVARLMALSLGVALAAFNGFLLNDGLRSALGEVVLIDLFLGAAFVYLLRRGSPRVTLQGPPGPATTG